MKNKKKPRYLPLTVSNYQKSLQLNRVKARPILKIYLKLLARLAPVPDWRESDKKEESQLSLLR